MTERENTLRAIRFDYPEHIPMGFYVSDACWGRYPQEKLFDLLEEHKRLFPHFVRPKGEYRPAYAPVASKDTPFTDDFGCIWKTAMNGITGTVSGHPLEDWSHFKELKMPDPEYSNGLHKINWSNEEKRIQNLKEQGEPAFVSLRHGHTFLQLCDMRGYQNFTYDMADEEPQLLKLIDMLEEFNSAIVEKYISMTPDMIGFPDDLGMQRGPMISPVYFRQYIKPSYQRLMKLARDKNIPVHMHSDGHLHDLIDDLIEGGVEVMNLQDLVNGIDWIQGRLAGKVCIELDLDRQSVTVNGSPAEIDTLIREEIKKLSSKQGGFMMVYGMYPGTPLANAKAVMDAMERYM